MGIGRGADIEPLLPMIYQRQVYRPQGLISAVILVDGYIRGTWEMEAGRSETRLDIRLFDAPSTSIQQGIEAEVKRLSAFLNRKVDFTLQQD